MSDNEIIAEFMGEASIGTQGTIGHVQFFDDYHENWSSLMPVVEKIYLIRTVEFEMSLGRLKINCLLYGGFYGSGFCLPEKTGIECWHMSVVEFIKWYNANNPKSHWMPLPSPPKQ